MKLDFYINVLKTEKSFRYILIANCVSRFGDSLDAIAYSWMVYQLTGSMAWLSVILGVNMIPTVLFQPLGGALTEYFDKKKVIVNCDVFRIPNGLAILPQILRKENYKSAISLDQGMRRTAELIGTGCAGIIIT